MANPVIRLQHISIAPVQEQDFEVWLAFSDALEFMNENASEDEFIFYAGIDHSFVNAILIPAASVNPPDIADLMSWSCNASSSWGISTTFSDPPRVWISPPLDHTGSKTLDGGEQLLFSRNFEARLGDDKGYFEVLQRFTHIFELHFLPERNAYCRIDKHGDIDDVIRICRIPKKSGGYGGSIVTFNRALLDEYLALTDSAIVRTFDFTRYRPTKFGGWSNRDDIKNVTDGDITYRSHIEPGHASYMRGFQIIRASASKESIIKRLDFRAEEEKQYASFIAHDWKNKEVRDISCAPGATANYFTESNLPFELSPAFFRPEVLSKYKADSEKYCLEDRAISCRGAWHLKTYDINSAGQVHTYLVYLRDLPYEEQLHWKAYNEKPKGTISSRAFKTDFEGTWDLTYDPLNNLKEALRELQHREVAWWTLRSEKLLDHVHYPVTSSADEWGNELLHLDQLVVEGFETKWLKEYARMLNRTPDPKFGSLKLVEECLLGVGYEEDRVRKIVSPLAKAHSLRSKLKGHATGAEAESIKKGALAEHGTFRKHFQILCAECDDSVRTITEAFVVRRPLSKDDSSQRSDR